MDNSLINLINNVDFVSFDIFDTLIQRNLNEPSDLFSLVHFVYENRYDPLPMNFKQLRISSEHKARKKNGIKEILINDIYKILMEESRLDLEVIKKLRDIELELEENLTVLNKEIYEVYEYCVYHDKTIVITSDFYLPIQNVKTILEKQDIKYNKLYLSSDLKMTKNNGNMYEYIIKDLDCKPNEILHIGDNINSDFKNAINKGLRAFHYTNKHDENIKTDYFKSKQSEEKDMFEMIDRAIIKNSYYQYHDDYWVSFGIKNIGILYYSFIKWLINDIKNKKIDKICFFSRDGFILKQVYDIISANTHLQLPESDYFLASRRALNVASLTTLDENEREMLLSYINGRSVKQLFKKMGLDSINYVEIIKDLGFTEESIIDLKEDDDALQKLLDLLKKDILMNSAEERKSLLKYINEKDIEDKNIAVVDIGWNGTLQWSLSKIMVAEKKNVNINGYYFGLNKRAEKYIQSGIKMKGFLYELDDRKDIFNIVSSFNAFFEELFIANHGSLIKFTDTGTKVEPYFEQFEYSNDEYKIIEKIQEGALIYVKKIYRVDSIYNLVKINPYVAIDKLKRIFLKPTTDEVRKLGSIIHFDYEKLYNCKPKGNLFKYIVNPNFFIEEYKKSRWKIGFLKLTFKFDVFCNIYILIKRLF